MSINAPMLSIIMPTFNHKKELMVMLNSILSNSFTDWELLIIDDGSAQDDLNVIQTYVLKDKRIRLLQRDSLPKGAPHCRNIGIDNAIGKYIIFFDSDDYVTPLCLENRVRAMEENLEIDFAIFPSGIFSEDQMFCTPDKNVYGYPIYRDDIKNFASRRLPFIVWNNIYRASSIRKYRLYWDVNLLSLQDADYNITAITCGMKYKYITVEPDYGYRVYSSASISKKICTDEHFRSHVHYIRNAYQKIQQAYGHKYDFSLFMGVLHIYNSAMTGRGIESSFSGSIRELMERYSPRYGSLFSAMVKTGLFFNSFLPSKTARQISMMPFLIFRNRKEKEKIKLIKKTFKSAQR